MNAANEQLVERAVARSAKRIFSVVKAFGALIGHSWTDDGLIEMLAAAERRTDPREVCQAVLDSAMRGASLRHAWRWSDAVAFVRAPPSCE